MMRILLLLAMLGLAVPAGAQTAAPVRHDAGSGVTVTLPAVPRISAGHAAALTTGMFAGVVAGTVMINGGAVAAVLGAVAGAVLGNWYWTAQVEPQD